MPILMQGIHLSIPRGVEIEQWIDTHIHIHYRDGSNAENGTIKKIGPDFKNYRVR